MNYFSFAVLGRKAGIMTPSPAVACRLRNDFAPLQATWDSKAIKLKIIISTPPAFLLKFFYFPFKPGIGIAVSGKRRVIRYENGKAFLFYDFAKEKGIIWSADINLAHETAYLTLLSRLGLQLDESGYHRVHALAIKVPEGGTGLVLGDSGAGKTSLALKLVSAHKALLYSDDFPLTDKNSIIYPFPARLGLKDGDRAAAGFSFIYLKRRRFGRKMLINFNDVRNSLPEPGQVSAICIINQQKAAEPTAVSISRLKLFYLLLRNLAVGLGLPQIAELLIPTTPAECLVLAKIFMARLGIAWRLSGQKKRFGVILSTDRAKSANFINRLLISNPNEKNT